MCLSPIVIKNKTAYPDSYLTSKFVQVPCGKCDQCRDMKHSEYLTRVSLELDDCYKKGGLGVFLTFTYSNSRIPRVWFPNLREQILCFDRQGVRDFLNLFKVYMWRQFGKDSYRYMMVSEYGKQTHRPHYHLLLLLKKHVKDDYVKVTELARHLWFDVLKNGFMFPKYSVRSGQYKDDHGSPCDPRVRSNISGAKYISKYVSKDVSFMEQSVLVKFLNSDFYRQLSDDDKQSFRNCLPRTWSSVNFGFAPLKKDTDSFFDYLKNGVFNPCTKEYDMMPLYLVNKFIYKSVRSDRLDKNNKVIYDRVYNGFYRKFHDKILDDRVFRAHKKLTDFKYLNKIDVSSTVLVDSAIHYTFYKSLTPQVYSNLYNRFGKSLYDLSFAKDLYFKMHDTHTLRYLHDCSDIDDVKLSYDCSSEFGTAVDFCDLFCCYQRWKNSQKLKKDFHDLANIQRLKSLKHKFNFNYDLDYDEF